MAIRESDQPTPEQNLPQEKESLYLPRPYSTIGRLIARGLRRTGYDVKLDPLQPEEDPDFSIHHSDKSNLYQLQGDNRSIDAYNRIYRYARIATDRKTLAVAAGAAAAGIAVVRFYLKHTKEGLPPHSHGQDFEG